jgi:hypothetical protein
VTVGHLRAYLEMVNVGFADVVERLRGNQLWAGSEVRIQDWLYDRIHAAEFSRDVLSVQTRRLVAMRMNNTGWNDLEHPEYVVAPLQTAGLESRRMEKRNLPMTSGGVRP